MQVILYYYNFLIHCGTRVEHTRLALQAFIGYSRKQSRTSSHRHLNDLLILTSSFTIIIFI